MNNSYKTPIQKRRKNSCERYKNLSKDEKQRLAEYKKNIMK